MSAAPLRCPRCAEPMQELEGAGGLRVDSCEACGGAWYDAGELAQALHVEGPLDPLREGSRRVRSVPCPRCERGLLELTWPAGADIRVDACPSCEGVFLDAGEVASVRRALRSAGRLQGAQPAPSEPSASPWRLPGGVTHRRAAMALVFLLVGQGTFVGALQAVRLLRILGDAPQVAGDTTLLVGAQLLGLPVGAALFGRLHPGHAPAELLMATPVAVLLFVALSPARPGVAALLGLLLVGGLLAALGGRLGDPSPTPLRGRRGAES